MACSLSLVVKSLAAQQIGPQKLFTVGAIFATYGGVRCSEGPLCTVGFNRCLAALDLGSTAHPTKPHCLHQWLLVTCWLAVRTLIRNCWEGGVLGR